VITAQRVQFAASVVAEAVASGARAHVVGIPAEGGHFVTSVLLDRVHEAMPVFLEELFIPVLPVLASRDATDAIRLANTGCYSLSASIFCRNESAAVWARQIEAGIVHLNLHTAYREPALPVGGWRESGRGLPECGRFARDFYTRSRAFYQLPS
jgi:alpha-ketoglutaric semialdehyde dehydrogenase